MLSTQTRRVLAAGGGGAPRGAEAPEGKKGERRRAEAQGTSFPRGWESRPSNVRPWIPACAAVTCLRGE